MCAIGRTCLRAIAHAPPRMPGCETTPTSPRTRARSPATTLPGPRCLNTDNGRWAEGRLDDLRLASDDG
eukprot:4562223-Pyramimonas_sp.AAC.1